MYSRWLILFVIIFNILLNDCQGADQSCSQSCDKGDEHNFLVGSTYLYDYKADSYTFFNIYEKNEQPTKVGLTMKAKVQLYIQSKCEFIMKITEAVIKQRTFDDLNNDKQKAADIILIEKLNCSVHVHYDNGRIQGICPTAPEISSNLNIKRGILSLMQFERRKQEDNFTVSETDILGICKSKYKVKKDDTGGKRVLERIRDLNMCTHRGGPYAPLRYLSLPNYVSNPLDSFMNIQKCKYFVGDDVQVSKIICEEKYDFHPHKTDPVIAVSDIKQQLVLDKIISEPSNADILTTNLQEKTSMLFDSLYEPETIKVENLKGALQESLKYDMKSLGCLLASSNFISLINNANFDELMDSFNFVNETERPDEYSYMTAVLRGHTSDTVRMVMYLFEKARFRNSAKEMWFVQAFLWKQPTSEILKDMKAALSMTFAEKTVNLAISAMANTFCKNNADCRDDPNLKFFVDYWDKGIQLGLNKNKEYDMLVIYLRAIGNVGITNNFDAIASIIVGTFPKDVRIAAFDACRKFNYETASPSFIKVFTNKEEDPELRILAYLAAMKYPSEDLFNHIKSFLSLEEVNEATSFIMDHLKKSTFPESLNNQVKKILNDNLLKTKYQRTIMDYAVYFEKVMTFSKYAKAKVFGVMWYKNKKRSNMLMSIKLSMLKSNLDSVKFTFKIEDIQGTLESFLLRKKKESPYSSYSFKVFDNDMFYNEVDDYLSILMKELISQEAGNENGGKTEPFKVFYTFPTGSGFPLSFIFTTESTFFLNKSSDSITNIPANFKFNGCIRIDTELTSSFVLDAYVIRSGLKSTVNANVDINVAGEVFVEENKVTALEYKISPEKILNVTSNTRIIN